MARAISRFFSVSFLGLSTAVSACGSNPSSDSEMKTVVGRGGAFFDRRVQVINALPDPLSQTTCLYLSEFRNDQARALQGSGSMTQEQRDFLALAEREAKPVTLYPVSIAALDYGLSEKETLRRLRGALSVPLGIASSFLGFGIVAAAMSPLCPGCFWGGMTLGQVLTNPLGLSFLGMGLGGFGLLGQAARDLNPRNQGIGVQDALADSSVDATQSNLGVTLAFVHVAQALPAASKTSCPANLAAESLQPYFESLIERHGAMSDVARQKLSSSAETQLKSSQGCYFSIDSGLEKIVYRATSLNQNNEAYRVQTYSVKGVRAAELISDEELILQMSSDGDSGRKYIADNERGSMALWISERSVIGKTLSAKLAHKMSNGQFASGKAQITGQCQL